MDHVGLSEGDYLGTPQVVFQMYSCFSSVTIL